LSLAGPKAPRRRATHGSAANTTTVVIASDLKSPAVFGPTYIPVPKLIVGTEMDLKPGATAAPRQTSDTISDAPKASAATPSQYPSRRTMPACLVTVHNPPATQESRR